MSRTFPRIKHTEFDVWPTSQATPISPHSMISIFPHFPRLPIELQICIWEHAASAGESVLLHLILMKQPVKAWYLRRYPHQFSELYHCFFSYPIKRHPGFHLVPKSLVRTARMARLIALERWKRNVEAIPVLEEVRMLND